MNQRSSFLRPFAVAAALSGLLCTGSLAQEKADATPVAPADNFLWLSIASQDLAVLRQSRDWGQWADWFEEIDSQKGVSLVLARESQVEALAKLMHRRFHRCGGFIAHATLAEGLDHLYVDRSPDSNAVFVTYTIDNPTVAQAMINEVQATNIVSTINLLAGNTTRYYTNAGGTNAANQLKSRWEGYATGRSDVSVALYSHAGWSQPSVIATITGTTLPNEVVVIGGHLDSINSSSPASGTAPGADDDASGVASLTEAFRAAMAQGFRPERTVKFMAYAAEEVGLRGSGEIATAYKNQGVNVVGVLQLDMTNYKGSTVDMAWLTDYTNAAQTTFLRDLLNTYLPTLTHTTTACGYACSDHASWHNQGFPASMPSEAIFGQHNQKIHTVNDTLANSDATAGHAAKFARLAAAYLAELAKGSLGTTTPNFGVSCSPSSLSVAQGANASTTCTVSSSGGFNSAVSMACTGLPAGVSCAFSPSSVTPPANGNATTTLQVTASGTATAGTTSIQAQGTSGSTVRSGSLSLTVTTAAGVLTNGVPVTGLAGATGSNSYFTLAVPAGATNLQFVTTGGTGDLDLYAQFGTQPTTTSYACSSAGGTNAETCTIASPSTGTYHVLLYGYAAYSGVQLTGSYTVGGGQSTVTFYSVAAEDGRIYESGETTSVGGGGNSTDSTTSAARIGDFSDDTQYRNIFSFDTSSIPDTATIVSATLRIKRGSLTGTNPFTTHGQCTVDISSAFGGATAFATGDFQAAAAATGVTTLSNPTTNGSFATGNLNAAGLAAINKLGKTQFRVYFTLDDNDDLGSDYIGLYTGEAATSNKPQLVVVYQ